ncbi:Pet127p [Sugiyamaella lignohabitans]|uniref:Pet127p n=1 Tax=Sugiyamaella lignohabitans TaxID=796027 RepID=A0A161HGK0_9ASCO|nr:Pet127p [Sugiyamaella lignohabitans]ANB10947.1 Pet127p [Sugiyamaella lignohabitans]
MLRTGGLGSLRLRIYSEYAPKFLSPGNGLFYTRAFSLSSTVLKDIDGLDSLHLLEKETYRDIKRQRPAKGKKSPPGPNTRPGSITPKHFGKKRPSRAPPSRVTLGQREPGAKPTFRSRREYEKKNEEQVNRNRQNSSAKVPKPSSAEVQEYIAKSPEQWKSRRTLTDPKRFSKDNAGSSSETTNQKISPANSPFPNFFPHETPYFRSFELDSSQLSYEPLEVPDQPPVPKLAHNLDRVLFSPGVHVLKDRRSNVYNFTPYLENIMSIKDFDFDFIAKYVPSGKDSILSKLAKENGKKYTGSTSSLTSVLSQFHHLLSHRRKPHTMALSKYFQSQQVAFSAIQTQPVSIFLRYNPNTDTHSIDSDKSYSGDIIVSVLGHQLEAMLTTEEEEFRNYHKSLSHKLDSSKKGGLNTYNYTQSGDFLMRSQLDCYDERLPGTGTFDLKTRAVCAVRHDMDYTQIHDGSDYQITKIDGEFESFSREWFELIRSTMFKYSLQARIGRMDGIFLAYHNVRRMFGFQYVPLSEIDQIYHTSDLIESQQDLRDIDPSNVSSFVPLDEQIATSGPIIAENEFKLSLKMFNEILDKIVASHEPAASFNLVFHTVSTGRMQVFVKPMLEKDIEVIQETGCDTEPKTGEEYSNNSDPHTILMHGNKNPEVLPPDVKVYQVDIRTYVNDKFVPGDKYPHLSSDSDVWKVQCEMSQLRQQGAERRFSRTFSMHKIENRITSVPQTERLDEEQEETIRNEALSKLSPPNAKQGYLRFLGAKGERLQREWEAQHGHKEKHVWRPS